jgi:ubiquinone/menaquinone biosynthesis C-methylase UbiE
MTHLPQYPLGSTDSEHQRLEVQANYLKPWTKRYLQAAGLAPGMSVLDLGSGVGDVALLAAELVGPAGRVVGIDRDPVATEVARQRAALQSHEGSVAFHVTDLLDYIPDQPFDAVIGRYILLYQSDAAATLRHFIQFAHVGTIFAFHEMDMTFCQSSCPPCPEWDEVYKLIAPAFRAAGATPDSGRHLTRTFLDAGLPTPTIEASIPIANHPDSFVLEWAARTVRSLKPLLDKQGIALPAGVSYAELVDVWRNALVLTGAQFQFPAQYGGWSQVA